MFLKRISGLIIAVLTAVALIFADCSADSAPQPHNTVIYLSYIDNLAEKDRALTLAADAVAAYKLESLPSVSLTREMEVENYLAPGDIAALWKGDKGAAERLKKQSHADLIVVGRHYYATAEKAKSGIRIFYLPLDGTVRTAMVEMENRVNSAPAFQKKLVEVIAGKLPFKLPADFWKKNSVTGNSTAFRLFGEGLNHISNQRTEAGLASLSKAGAADGDFRDLNYYLGRYFASEQSNYQQSIFYMKKIIKKRPEDAGAHFWLGFVRRLQGNYPAATDEFKKAVSCKPSFHEAYLHLGMMYSDTGNYELAAKNYRAALNVEPNVPAIWYSLACALASGGNDQEAIKALRRALELDRDTFYRLAKMDADLAPLHKLQAYKDMMAEMKPK